MDRESLSMIVSETRNEIRALILHASVRQQKQAMPLLSVQEDPCQPELDTIDALLTEFDTFFADWTERLAAAAQALICCRDVHPNPQTP